MAVKSFVVSADGYLRSLYATYADARTGPANTADATTTNYPIGQRKESASEYRLYEIFMDFDTSWFANGYTIRRAWLEFWTVNFLDHLNCDFTVEARAYDWGASLATGDWIAGANLGNYTLLASADSSAVTEVPGVGYQLVLEDTGAFAAAINPSGSTRIVIAASKIRTGDAPTALENFNFWSAEADYAPFRPVLCVEYSPPPATYKVEVAWDTVKTGVFTIDTSTIAGTDVLDGFFGTYVWSDITANVQQFSVSRGRTDDLQASFAGSASLELVKADGVYDLTVVDRLWRPVRITATWNGTTYGLFYGYIRNVSTYPGAAQGHRMTISCTDAMGYLEGAKPTIDPAPSTLYSVGTAIGRLLDYVDWPSANRTLATGRSCTLADGCDGSQSALSVIDELLYLDGGIFYIDGDGNAVFQDHDSWTTSPRDVPQYDVSASANTSQFELDIAHVLNEVAVEFDGKQQYMTRDVGSQGRYGVRTAPALTDKYCRGMPFYLSERANDLISFSADARPRARMTMIDDIEAALTIDIWDHVTISEITAEDSSYHIEQITHTVTEFGKRHEVEWYCTRRTA